MSARAKSPAAVSMPTLPRDDTLAGRASVFTRGKLELDAEGRVGA